MATPRLAGATPRRARGARRPNGQEEPEVDDSAALSATQSFARATSSSSKADGDMTDPEEQAWELEGCRSLVIVSPKKRRKRQKPRKTADGPEASPGVVEPAPALLQRQATTPLRGQRRGQRTPLRGQGTPLRGRPADALAAAPLSAPAVAPYAFASVGVVGAPIGADAASSAASTAAAEAPVAAPREPDTVEEGWRWDELLGGNSGGAGGGLPWKRGGARRPKARDMGDDDGWRMREIMSMTECASISELHVATQPAPVAPVPAVKRCDPNDDDDDDWRMREVCGASGSAQTLSVSELGRSSQPARGGPRRRGDDGWRMREIMGATAATESEPTSPASPLPPGATGAPKRSSSGCPANGADETPNSASTPRSCNLLQEKEDEASPGLPQKCRSSPDCCAPASEEADAACPREVLRPELGDVVLLGAGAPPEYRLRPAVVTALAESYCTVVVLDSDRRLGIGECWPCFQDVAAIESSLLRLGTRVVLRNMSGARTRRLNGFTGVVSAHPKQGHPTFVNKSSSADTPQLTVCIKFDDSAAAGERSALIEPRFLAPYQEAIMDMTFALTEACGMVARKMGGEGALARQLSKRELPPEAGMAAPGEQSEACRTIPLRRPSTGALPPEPTGEPDGGAGAAQGRHGGGAETAAAGEAPGTPSSRKIVYCLLGGTQPTPAPLGPGDPEPHGGALAERGAAAAPAAGAGNPGVFSSLGSYEQWILGITREASPRRAPSRKLLQTLGDPCFSCLGLFRKGRRKKTRRQLS